MKTLTAVMLAMFVCLLAGCGESARPANAPVVKPVDPSNPVEAGGTVARPGDQPVAAPGGPAKPQ